MSESAVVTGELGANDCNDRSINNYMSWADRNHVSYLGSNWNDWGPNPCGNAGPTLIQNPQGKPTVWGAGFRHHLRQLWLRNHRRVP